MPRAEVPLQNQLASAGHGDVPAARLRSGVDDAGAVPAQRAAAAEPARGGGGPPAPVVAASRVGGKLAIALQCSRGGRAVPQNFHSWRGNTVPDYPDSRIFQGGSVDFVGVECLRIWVFVYCGFCNVAVHEAQGGGGVDQGHCVPTGRTIYSCCCSSWCSCCCSSWCLLVLVLLVLTPLLVPAQATAPEKTTQFEHALASCCHLLRLTSLCAASDA